MAQLLIDWEPTTSFRWNLGLRKPEGERNELGRDLVSSSRTANAHADYLSQLNIVNLYFANV